MPGCSYATGGGESRIPSTASEELARETSYNHCTGLLNSYPALANSTRAQVRVCLGVATPLVVESKRVGYPPQPAKCWLARLGTIAGLDY